MAGVLDDILNFFFGLFDMLTKNFLGTLILGAILLYLYLRYGKAKPINLSQEIFKKQWEATTETLKISSIKKLGLCSLPMTIEELKNLPMHQLKYESIGDVIGINMTGVRTSIKKLLEISKKMSKEQIEKFLIENKDQIDLDKFWVIFAIRRRVGGFFLFPNIRKTLLFCKMNQIINIDSNDSIVRVRGYGIQPQGEYELIVDNNYVINAKQLSLDTADVTFEEVTLGTLGYMGQLLQNAINLDSTYKKDVAMEGIKILPQPTGQEVRT